MLAKHYTKYVTRLYHLILKETSQELVYYHRGESWDMESLLKVKYLRGSWGRIGT